MMSIALIVNFVGLGIGAVMIIAGLMLLAFGIFTMVKKQYAVDAAEPSYAESVDYPSEPGVPQGFQSRERWADGIATEETEPDSGDAVDATENAGEIDDHAAEKKPARKVSREKWLVIAGGLLLVFGLVLLFNGVQAVL